MSAFSVIVGGALLVLAQQAPRQPTFRAATELVEVDVRVFGADGRFVATLTADDFELSEDGVPQPIDVLYLVAGGRARVVSAEASAGAPTRDGTPVIRQTWIFVFDITHLSRAGLNRTRDAVRGFISSRFLSGEVGGIVGEHGMVDNRLTSDRGELDRAVASLELPGGRRSTQLEMREWPRIRDEVEAVQIARNDREALRMAFLRACGEEPERCKNPAQIEMMLMEKARSLASAMQTSSRQTVRTLDALTRGLARVPGPKTVVLLSEGFISQHLESEVQTIVAQAGVAGARIYSIDAKGLARGGLLEVMDPGQADSSIGALGSGRDMLVDGVNSLAVDTGGFAIRNENTFGRALDAIERDSGTYYVAGYRPTRATGDGEFRRIDVRVKRPGLEVRARRGYLALPRARLLTLTSTPEPVENDHSRDEHTRSPLSVRDLPAPSRSAGLSEDAIRKILELARDASSARGAANADVGWAAYQRGDLETAASELGAAVQAGDTRAWVRYALGFAHAARGEWKAAVRVWERVRADVPQYQETYFDLADAHLQTGDPAAAVAVLREAEKRWPADAEVYNALGVVQIGRGAIDDAVQTFEKAVKAAPRESLAYFNLGRAYSMRYFKSQRYNAVRGAWVGNTRDRDRAAEQFERYLALGGPYEAQAREALAALAWK